MPHRKKKSFIQKKSSVTFHLVHRSQKDPLVADENAPQRVLLPAERADVRKQKEEQRKYGVFFDDAYNYLQHLKEASPVAELVASSSRLQGKQEKKAPVDNVQQEVHQIPSYSINLPSSVFASEFEEETGLLNKAAPVRGPLPELDPDIVAALDEDFDFDDPDNILEDDFVMKAVANESETVPRTGSDGEDNDEDWEDTEDEDYDSDGPLSSEDGSQTSTSKRGPPELLFMDEETRSRFTNYSITSSVMRRNEQLTLLDDRFEKLYAEYDDDEIGALDHHELEGCIQVDSERLGEVIADYHNQKSKDCQMPDDLGPRAEVQIPEEEEEDVKGEMETLITEEVTEQWDCESILSTYSNLYNHPKLIIDPPKPSTIKVSIKTGIPLGVLPKPNLTAKQLERLEMINVGDVPRASTQIRQHGENKEEKRFRKQAIKVERKERRIEKKTNRAAFKMEKVRQEQVLLNLKQNLQGIKL